MSILRQFLPSGFTGHQNPESVTSTYVSYYMFDFSTFKMFFNEFVKFILCSDGCVERMRRFMGIENVLRDEMLSKCTRLQNIISMRTVVFKTYFDRLRNVVDELYALDEIWDITTLLVNIENYIFNYNIELSIIIKIIQKEIHKKYVKLSDETKRKMIEYDTAYMLLSLPNLSI